MISDWIKSTDFQILDWIRMNCHSDALDWFMPKLTFLGEKGWFFIAMAAILLIFKKTRKQGGYFGIAYALGFLFGNILIKNAVERARPYDQVEGITLLVDKLSDYSFPSGHTLVAFEFFAVMLLLPIKWIYKVLAGILAVTMAFSRLYLYVHFPSDVLAGAVLGTLFGVMAVRMLDSIIEERIQKKQGNDITEESIQQKAGTIAERLEAVEEVLDQPEE